MSPMLPLFVLLLLPSLPLVTCEDDPTMQSLMTLVQQQAATIQTLQAKMTSLENGAQTLQTTLASLENSAQQSQATHQTVQALLTTVASLGSSAQQSLATQQTLQTKVASLEGGEQTLQARMTSVEHGAQQSLATQQTLQTKVTSLESSAHQLLATEQQHTGQIAAINTRLNTQVFFNAHMSSGPIDIGTNNAPMKFNAVTYNVGNGYNPLTGVFTAPVTGTYVMYAQIMKDTNQGNVHYVIDKSGTVLCFNGVDGADIDKSSCLASVHLQKGETVIVRRHEGGQRLFGWMYCAFSGFLVSADAS